MPRWVLHIGPTKTGTTYLQTGLRLGRPVLAARGIAFPLDWWPCRMPMNHKHIFNEIRSPHGTRLRDAIEAQRKSDAHTVVLSFEGFVGLKRGELVELRRMLGADPVDVVFYFRRWCERIPSTWHQAVRGGGTRGFVEHLLHMTLNADHLLTLNYAAMLDKFADVFGRDSLLLISYNQVIQRREDLFQHFCRTVLGFDGQGITPPRRRNESGDVLDSEMHRALNLIAAEDGHGPEIARSDRAARSMRVRAMLARTDLSALRARMRPYLSDIRLSDNAPVFRPMYEDLTKRYLDKLVDRDEDNVLFHRAKRTVQYVRSDYLLQKGTCDLLRDLQRHVRYPQ